MFLFLHHILFYLFVSYSGRNTVQKLHGATFEMKIDSRSYFRKVIFQKTIYSNMSLIYSCSIRLECFTAAYQLLYNRRVLICLFLFFDFKNHNELFTFNYFDFVIYIISVYVDVHTHSIRPPLEHFTIT